MNVDERELRYADLTRKIIGCAMVVHNTLGSGFPEVIYQSALAVEFVSQDIVFDREEAMPVFYKGVHIGTRRIDFFIEPIVLPEIKATSDLTDTHLAQGLNYLEAFNMEAGLLINFWCALITIQKDFEQKV